MASCGLRSKDVRNLKIKDFLRVVQIESIEELFLTKENLVGYWEIKPSKTKRRKFTNKIRKDNICVKLEVTYILQNCFLN